MNRDFYFIVLLYLKENGGLTKQVDISDLVKEHVSDQRNVRTVILTQVNKEIDFIFESAIKNGDIKNYTNTTPGEIGFDSDRYYLNKIKVSAQLTKKGDKYLKSQESKKPKLHIENSQNVIVGNDNHQSSSDNSHQAKITPINSPIPRANKSHKYKSIRVIIIGIITGLILICITIWLKSCGVNAQVRF